MSVEYDIAGFREGEDDEEAAPRRADVDVGRREVLGTLIVLGVVESEHLEEDRPVLVWLPPGYDEPENADRRYPVLYMHDGQNLFEPDKAFTGVDWGVDEAVVGLVEEGKMPPIIVVGVFSTRRRLSEYNPFKLGDDYARFLIEELKPRIDAGYRTRPEPRFTGTMGSSAGGLISVGLGWRHPDNFGRVGALSAHLPPIGEEMGGTGESLLDAIEATGLDRSLRIYVDQSTEGPDATYDYDSHRERFAAMLAGWGWTDGEDYMMRRFEDTRHTEADWRARLHIPLEFLFGDAGESDNGATGDQSSE